MEYWKVIFYLYGILLVGLGVFLCYLWFGMKRRLVDICALRETLRTTEKQLMKIERRLYTIEKTASETGVRMDECMDALAEVTKLSHEAIDISRESRNRCITAEAMTGNALDIAKEIVSENEKRFHNYDICYELLRNDTNELRRKVDDFSAKIVQFPGGKNDDSE